MSATPVRKLSHGGRKDSLINLKVLLKVAAENFHLEMVFFYIMRIVKSPKNELQSENKCNSQDMHVPMLFLP